MRYTVEVLPRANADIDGAVRWRSQRSPAAAVRWQTGVFTALRSLATNPDRWPLADEAGDLGLELRELCYGRRGGMYRILFTIDGQTVNVHRIRHAAQDRLAADDV